MSSRRSPHDCYKYYELKSYKSLFKCDGCKMNGFGERYKCYRCGNYLHKECRYPKSPVSHENFPGSSFKFYRKPCTKRDKNNRREFSKCCDACGKDICGFSYHCNGENLDLHPCCRNLKNKIVTRHMIFNLVTKVSSKCVKCRKLKISGDAQGWSYVSNSQGRTYSLHVYCMTDMIQEAYMKRVDLTLDSRELVRYNKNRNGTDPFIKGTKGVIKLLLSVFLGDPTMLISNAIVEFFFLPLQL